MSDQTFTTENINNLKQTCQKIISILDENVDGAFNTSQLEFLADDIKEFIRNPIVKGAGIL